MLTYEILPTNRRRQKKPLTAKTPEGVVKQQIKDILDSLGAWWFMPATYGYGRSGVPDFIVCYKGNFIAIEAKSNKTTHPVTALQQRELDKISGAEGLGLVVDEDNVKSLSQLLLEMTSYETYRDNSR